MYSNYIEERRSSSSSRQNSPGMNSSQRSPWHHDENHRSQNQSGSLNNHSPEEHHQNTSESNPVLSPEHGSLLCAQGNWPNSVIAFSTVPHPSHKTFLFPYPYHRTTTGITNVDLPSATTDHLSQTPSMGNSACCSTKQMADSADVYGSPSAKNKSATSGDRHGKDHGTVDEGSWRSGGRNGKQPKFDDEESRRLLNRGQEERLVIRLSLKDGNVGNDGKPEHPTDHQSEEAMDYEAADSASSGRRNPVDQSFSAADWGRGRPDGGSSNTAGRASDVVKGAGATQNYTNPDHGVSSGSQRRSRNSGSLGPLETCTRHKALPEMPNHDYQQNYSASKYSSPVPPIVKTTDDVLDDKKEAGERPRVHGADGAGNRSEFPNYLGPEQQGKKPRRDGSRQRKRSKSRGEGERENQTVIQMSQDTYNQLLSGGQGQTQDQRKCQDQGFPTEGQESRPVEKAFDTNLEAMDTDESAQEMRGSVPKQRHDERYGKRGQPGPCSAGIKTDGIRNDDRDPLTRRPLHKDRATDFGGGDSYRCDQYQQPNDDEMADNNMIGDEMKNMAETFKNQNSYRAKPDNKKHEEVDDEDEDTDDDTQYENPDAGKPKNLSEFKDKLSFIQNTCKKENKEGLTIYQAKLMRNRGTKIRKLEYGCTSKSAPEKVIMLVGSTGAGKSTMMNAIFNYMFGIKWNDDYRMKLVPDEVKPGQVVNQAVSQTRKITAYTIHHQPWFTVPYTLTIIDTPGFGDTGGIKRDKQITEQIRNFFQTKDSNGIDHLDAVGFVTQSSLPRLAPAQRYVFDSILAIFGKDIEENIFMLLTFADGRKPQVLSGLKEANMKYQNFYKFNNSALYVGKNKVEEANSDEDDDEDDDDNFDEMFWKMGATNFKKFMTDLESVKAQSLTLTAEVLEERHALETTVNSISEHVKRGLKKLEQLQTEQDLLKSHEADLHRNKNFTYEYQGYSVKTINLNDGKMAANCQNCLESCHFPCNHMFLRKCRAISWMGNCRQCTEKCPVSFHEKQPFFYVWEEETYRGTYDDIKRRYEDAEGKRFSAEQLIEKSKGEFDQVQKKTFHLMQEARECLAKLDEIALKPNPLSTTDYIDLMIQEEEFMKEPGWKETVKQLKEVKKRANDLLSATSESFDPFDKHTRTSTKM